MRISALFHSFSKAFFYFFHAFLELFLNILSDYGQRNDKLLDALLTGFRKNQRALSFSQARIKEIYEGSSISHNSETEKGISVASLVKKDK